MNTKKIFLSLSIIVGVAALAYGTTRSFFSDSETSTGNTFTAGAIDLKIDNESYVTSTTTGQLALNPKTSWTLRDLTIEKFFDFADVKPGDVGEDTISLHVDNNDSWLCAAVKLTSDNENTRNSPEIKDGDLTDDPNGGELADHINFIWWADDGDNVLEVNELVLPGGPIGALGVGDQATVSLADSETNIWGDQGPLPGNSERFIGKGWCFGNLTPAPIAQDGQGKTGSNGPLVRGTGFNCDGSQVNNTAQTDSLTADVTFTAIQSRNNSNYLCTPREEQPTATTTLTVIKQIVNDNGGNATTTDFALSIEGNPTTSGTPVVLAAGSYTVSELGVGGYASSFSGDCDSLGEVVLAPGDNKTCTITNNDIQPNITLTKVVLGDAQKDPNDFLPSIGGVVVASGSSLPVNANTPVAIDETFQQGYSFTSITGDPKCPGVLGGTATLDEGEAISCTITNTKDSV